MELYLLKLIFFFFSSRRRHTRFKCDWSSDVCSSDLLPPHSATFGGTGATNVVVVSATQITATTAARAAGAVDRKSVVEGKRVDLGGRRIIKKKKKKRAKEEG